MYLKFFYDSYVTYWDWYGFELFMIHMLDIGIGIDDGIGLYCRKQHFDSFGNSCLYCTILFFFFGCTIVTRSNLGFREHSKFINCSYWSGLYCTCGLSLLKSMMCCDVLKSTSLCIGH